MKKFLAWFLTIVLALAAGIGSTVWVLKRHAENNWVASGNWVVNTNAGSEADDLYSKATIAMGGLLALNPKETLYYVTSFDDQHRKLNSRCSYRVEGVDPDTRWWSMTVYGGDFMLIDNPDNNYSADHHSVKRATDGSWTVHLSREKVGENWVPTGKDDQQLYLLMRMYHPGKSIYDNYSKAPLPRVVRLSCQ